MDPVQTRNVLEACLLVAGRPMTISQLDALFEEDIDRPDRKAIREALLALADSYAERGIELVEVAGGWRLQTRSTMEHWVVRLSAEKAPRYSRALLETLVLIAYRQPITRGEIEEVRGVAVSSNIVRTLQDRRWVREVGFKEVPGRPALLGTTSEFLDYFNLKRLDELPPLGELKDIDTMEAALAAELDVVEGGGEAANDDGGEPTVDGASTTSSTDPGNVESDSTDVRPSTDADPSEPVSEAQSRMLDRVEAFAEEHRRELATRDGWRSRDDPVEHPGGRPAAFPVPAEEESEAALPGAGEPDESASGECAHKESGREDSTVPDDDP